MPAPPVGSVPAMESTLAGTVGAGQGVETGVGDMAVCRERRKKLGKKKGNRGGEENRLGSVATRDAVQGTGNEGRTTCRTSRISR